ncbi:hypothetical protein [Streptomyces pini]|uniref:Secreted protein n=1 Tax=Streptomyces pini TaxID=1520580 RepID=A0A1I4GXK2_9ACTN|nr:hypothetical protein [Streptomyces pini]SFL33866.1 hypothetical protein SAMN05192584_11741 [Streptomyces pini]
MRTRTAATATATAAVALLAATAVPANAAAPAAVGWSVQHGTAAATGERWTEPSGGWPSSTLVIEGELTNTGAGCYSVWTRFVYDLAPGPVRKHAEICGPGSVEVDVRQSYWITTTGSITVCRGTEDTSDCGTWRSVTTWPANRR